MSDALAVNGSGGGLEMALTLSQRLAKSGLIPRALHGKPDDVLVVLLRGQELGLGPMQALAGIHVIEGKGVCSADLIVALCAKRRDVCEYFRLVESTEKRATYETRRAGFPEPTRISFTIEEAQRAKLTGKDNWQKYTAAMLRARCSTALARAVYPDLAMGLYDPDEAEDFQRNAPVVPIQAAPSAPLEREVNAAPAASRTSRVAAEVAAKVEAPKAEAKALPASTAEYERILARMDAASVPLKEWAPKLKEFTGKTKRADVTKEDADRVLAFFFPEPPADTSATVGNVGDNADARPC